MKYCGSCPATVTYNNGKFKQKNEIMSNLL